jgi:hypothetical protein
MIDRRAPAEPPRTRLSSLSISVLFEALVAAAVVLIGVLYAKHMLAATFRPHDDEGYMLLSLQRYLRLGGLYKDTFSEYGPFYFYAQEAWFRLLHLPVTHDAGRLVALIDWTLAALLAGAFVYRISKNILIASAASLASTLLSAVLADEPGHPQQVILVLFMLSGLLALCAGSHQRLSLFLLAVIGVALVFTKINVGLFYVVALAHTFFCLLASGRLRTAGICLMVAYAIAAPVLLMRSNLFGWAGGYCLVAVLCGTVTFVCASLVRTESSLRWQDGVLGVFGMLLAALSIVVGTSLQSMSIGTLINGVILEPLRHPQVFYVPLTITPWEVVVTALAVGCVGTIYLFPEWFSADSLDALQCVVGTAAIFLLLWLPWRFYLIMPFLPLGVISGRMRTLSLADLFPRVFITCLASTQFLQAYPVGGSQINVAAIPTLLWGFVCFSDGVDGLYRLWRRASIPFLEMLPKRAIVVCGLAVALSAGLYHLVTQLRTKLSPPSNLSGSASLHLKPDQESRYEFLVGNIRANCDMLFTLPGMGSLNLWSGVPTPNGSNLGPWVRALNSERQQQILQIIQADPRACVVYNSELVPFWRTTPQELRTLPLPSYILRDMPKAADRDGYEIRIHPNRNSAWISTAGSHG